MMSEGDIDASNVLPAFAASLLCGATEDELETVLGWRRDQLNVPGARVSGASTYAHFELMAQKPDYPRFVLLAAEMFLASSMGAVGLACRSCASMAEAFACHGRFQALTNRSAEYAVSVVDNRLVIEEHRHGPPRLGSLLMSDHTMLVAVQLLRSVAVAPPKVQVLRSRRSVMPDDERAAYESFLQAPIELGAPLEQLELDAALLQSAVATADPELAAYFEGVLHQAAGSTVDEDPLLQDVRRFIRKQLAHGAPTAAEAASAVGLGQRTLQRRLSALGRTYGDVVEDTRRTMADLLLADPRMSLAEVAYLLGYTEQASFFRAFRRWFGTTPGAHRQTLLR